MKLRDYILRILLFAIVYLAMVLAVNNWMFNKAHKAYFENLPGKNLVLGDSGFFLLNEFEMKQTKNLSLKGSIYKVMYHKLREITKYKKVDKLVLPFSYSNFGAINDNVLAGNKNTEEYIRRLYPITNPFSLFTDGTDFLTASKVLVKYVLAFNYKYFNHLINGDVKEDFVDIRFESHKAQSQKINNKSILTLPQKFANNSYLRKRIPQLYYSGEETPISSSAKHYFEEIKEYCKMAGIELILVRMPLSRKYQSQVPRNVKAAYEELHEETVNQELYTFLDYMNLYNRREASTHFGNDDHLTIFAAAEISKLINKTLNK